MLLVIDVGNTNTTLGVYADDKLIAHWRLATERERTVDEYGILCRNLFTFSQLDPRDITGIAIASVVPPLNFTFFRMAQTYFGHEPFFVRPTENVGMPIRYDVPQDVGADRIVNAVAAYARHGGPCVVVDFGTATTFDAISKDGTYLGGVIAPGIVISAEALFQRAARLPRVSIAHPSQVIGTSTIGSIQSGLYFGYIGLVEGILQRMQTEMGKLRAVIATGGLARLIGKGSSLITEIDENLTLEGLRLIYQRNTQQA
jgi:pantothenate kinase (EC 2.7.1.33)